MIFNVPNIITFGRILVIPILLVLFLLMDPDKGEPYNKVVSFWAAVVFTLAAISDLIDGYYARKYGAVSVMGKFIDPMADKLLHMTALVLLIPLDRIPAWVVVILLFREIFISGIRAMAAGEGLIIAAGEWGKKKTAWLNVGIIGLTLHYPWFVGTVYELNVKAVGIICLVVGFIYSVASAISYTAEFFKKVIR